MTTPNTQPETAVERVKLRFLAALEKDGIEHTFEWMQGWFGEVAAAVLEDRLKNSLGEHAKNPDARGLFLTDLLMDEARRVSNYSSLSTSNLMRQARVAALADMVNRGGGYAGSIERSDRTDALREQLAAARESRASTN